MLCIALLCCKIAVALPVFFHLLSCCSDVLALRWDTSLLSVLCVTMLLRFSHAAKWLPYTELFISAMRYSSLVCFIIASALLLTLFWVAMCWNYLLKYDEFDTNQLTSYLEITCWVAACFLVCSLVLANCHWILYKVGVYNYITIQQHVRRSWGLIQAVLIQLHTNMASIVLLHHNYFATAIVILLRW